MAKDSPVDFFSEFEELLDRVPFQPFAIILMSGDRLDILAPDECVALKMMYFYYPPHGATVMFPFPNVCAIEIHPH